MAITIGEAVVKAKLDTKEFNSQLKAMSKAFNKSANFLSKTIIAPAIALGSLGVFKYLKTTDALARATNASIISLKISFNQLLFRIGETIIKKFKLIETMDKLRKVIDGLDEKKINTILDVVKWTAVSVIVMKLASGLLNAARAINTIRNGVIAMEGAKVGGAVATGASTGIGSGIGSGISLLIYSFREQIKKMIIKYLPVRSVSGAPLSGMGVKELYVGRGAGMMPMTGNREVTGLTTNIFSSLKLNSLYLVKSLLGLSAVVYASALVFKALKPYLGEVADSFKESLPWIVTFSNWIKSLGGILNMLSISFDYLKASVGLVADSFIVAMNIVGAGIASLAAIFTDILRLDFFDIKDDLKGIFIDLDNRIKDIVDNRAKIFSEIGKERKEQAPDKKVFASSISSTSIEGLNRAFQEYYSQTMALDVQKDIASRAEKQRAEQIALLQEIRDNKYTNKNTNVPTPKVGEYFIPNSMGTGSIYNSTMDMIRSQGQPVF